MIRQKKQWVSKVLTGIFIFLLINMNAFSIIYINGAGEGYEGGGDGDKTSGYNHSIETYVIEGAGYFLNGHSSIQVLLNRLELQDVKGVDYTELHRLINNALENITHAAQTYEQLIETAEATPYNLDFIEKLKDFDYKTYLKENGLNEVVFKNVETYLSAGDITGSFKHAYSLVKNIEALLIIIKDGISANRVPGLPVLWKLNELCSEFAFFGSYAARVFHSIP